jgi:hypothetical protein
LDRKKAIRDYKQTPTPMGILGIRNTADGKLFLLAAKNLPGIMNSQRFSLRHGSHPNRELQADFKRLGEDAFSFEVLDTLEPKEGAGFDYTADLKALEQMWLERLQPFGDKGYHTAK